MKHFSSSETNPILRAAHLEPVPIGERMEHEVLTPYSNDFVEINIVPSRLGPFTSVKTGGTNKGVIVLIHKNGKLLLTSQPRYATGLQAWETPRGKIHPGENFITSASREVKDQTGITIPAENLKSLGRIHSDSGILSTHIEAFFVDITSLNSEWEEDNFSEELSSVDDAQFFPICDVEVALSQGFIYDSLTATVFLRARTRKYF
jgi:predicted NUDIX family NTP pyrophosphohydrolase